VRRFSPVPYSLAKREITRREVRVRRPSSAWSLDWPDPARGRLQALLLGAWLCSSWPLAAAGGPRAEASGNQAGCGPAGAADGDRFSADSGHAWKGGPQTTNWWWQVSFASPRPVGAILQVQGDHPFVFTNAPARYAWQASLDGHSWHELSATRVADEQRCFRLHRLPASVQCRFLRLTIEAAAGEYPTLREVEFFPETQAIVSFPDWFIVVNTTHERWLPNHGQEFIPLARSTPEGKGLQAQQVWLTSFDEAFVSAEPRPLCAFLSGNFKDWCEIDRRWWCGTEQVLQAKRLPMWASCGGAQGLALLAEYGTAKAWDCPHCRDPDHPKTPIYTHIGHTAHKPCGDYSACEFERGKFAVRQISADPVFAGLPPAFESMESHCGQIEWAPAGWELVATAGPGTKTRTQCLRLKDHPVYAAQFHIEMSGTPEVSKQIMSNFLGLAKAWGGYNPHGKATPMRPPWSAPDR
jgi:hypothetical protein